MAITTTTTRVSNSNPHCLTQNQSSSTSTMAPIAITETTTAASTPSHPLKLNLRGPAPPEHVAQPGRNRLAAPLPYTGSLDGYSHFEVTPSIGREFGKDLQLTDLLRAENSDELIRDLGVLSELRACAGAWS
jgi:hypothetical protein